MNDSVVQHLSSALVIFVTMCMPALAAAMVVGLLVAILQAATQIQDQSLPQTLKLMVVVGVFGLMSSALITPLVVYTETLFAEFPMILR